MKSIVFHSDLNCFYASVEVNEDPSLAGKKVAVCGSQEDRHGIVLTATYPAKRAGVKTGMAIWQAQQVCPDVIIREPRYDLYMKYSRMVRRIYRRYSDAVEPFGMDECWVALEGTEDVAGVGAAVADEIRRTVRSETGLTVSVGVSFSKVLAKLGSDMKKPDAVTVLSRENFRERIAPLPASDLLYVGPATTRKLRRINVRTIGELAGADPEILRSIFGKNGVMLWQFANGLDLSPVMPCGYEIPVKSVGHGATCVRDLDSDYEVWQVLYELSQDVGHRLRADGLQAKGVQLTVRDSALLFYQYHAPLHRPSRSPLEIARQAYELYLMYRDPSRQVRALTVCADRLESDRTPVQTDLFLDHEARDRRRAADDAVDEIRRRFGDRAVRAASLLGESVTAQDRCETVPMPAVMYR